MIDDTRMKRFFYHSFAFWFVLFVLAIGNAIVREVTYKPLLEPIIGIWAHQISAVIAIFLFFGAIYAFLSYEKGSYTRRDLTVVGVLWFTLTVIFECFMNLYIRKLSLMEVLETYYFWKGELWVFVLLSLFISPFAADAILKK